jgi:hypothetical protein
MDEIKKRALGNISDCTRNRFLLESHWLLLALAALSASVALGALFLPEPGQDAVWLAAGHLFLAAFYLCAAALPLCSARIAGLGMWIAYVIYAGTIGQSLLTMAAVSLAIVAVFAVRTVMYHGVDVTPGAKGTT